MPDFSDYFTGANGLGGSGIVTNTMGAPTTSFGLNGPNTANPTYTLNPGSFTSTPFFANPGNNKPLGAFTGNSFNGDPNNAGVPSPSSNDQGTGGAQSGQGGGSQGKFKPNPLSSLFNYTYKWKLFVTKEDVQSPEQAKNASKVIIAESGVTAGYNIREVKIKTYAIPNFKNGLTNASNATFEITIVEPVGTSFLDAWGAAAEAQGIENLTGHWVCAELTFLGYDEEGNPVLNPTSGSGGNNGGIWIYKLNCTNVSMDVEASGSVYKLTAQPWEMVAQQPHMAMTTDVHSVQGKTLGEQMKNLAQSLNKSVQTRYGFDAMKYDIKLHPIRGKENPESFSTVPQEPEINPIRSFSMKEKHMPQTHIPRASHFFQYIPMMLGNTEKAQQYAKDVMQRDKLDESPGRVNGKGFRESVLYTVEPILKMGEFNQKLNDYTKQITLHVLPYITTRSMMSPTQLENLKDPSVQQSMLQSIEKNGDYVKRYDYIYTGLNTEVLSIKNTHFDFPFVNLMPRNEGSRNNVGQYLPSEKCNPHVEGSPEGNKTIDQQKQGQSGGGGGPGVTNDVPRHIGRGDL